MNLSWSQEDEAFRAALVDFLDANAPPEVRGHQGVDEGFDDGVEGRGGEIPRWARDWQATLFDNGWMVPAYPPELGGRYATPIQSLIYLEEMARRGIPRSLNFPGYAIVAPSLLEFGTEAQKALAPAALRGDAIWCIGMSEPGAGSDLASLSTRAVRDGDHFVVNGQKVWTSYANVADRCFLYTRTTPLDQAPKHRGITVFILDMDTPGIEVRPLRHITGAADFAEVFFTDVEIPRENIVGEQDDGWRITMGSLAHERGGLWLQSVAQVQRAVDDLVALARLRGRALDSGVRRQVASAYERVASLRALGYKGFASFAQGSSAPEHSFLKLATSELAKELYELGMQLDGPFGVALEEPHGRWNRSFFVSFASTIAGGSSEIQRNIIATRLLGLPRS